MAKRNGCLCCLLINNSVIKFVYSGYKNNNIFHGSEILNININGGIIPKAISSGDDLNNYLTNGRYHAFAAIVSKSLLNNPISSQDNGVILDVIKETSSALQILYGTALGGLFTRRYANGGWSDWVEYLKVSDLLNKIKSVDGANSGLDADTLDGTHLNGIF